MTAKATDTDSEMRMSGREFDRIMGKALQVKPDGGKLKKAKPKAKKKRTR
ncbi:MAG TPA: hypothetical protein VII49_09840 [Rhizomicrobium sp.]